MNTQFFDFTAVAADGSEQSLSRWKGHVVLVVNTASQCGFTPQLQGLQALQTRYAAQAFTVLAFPCNQFGGQEPGNAQEIAKFCDTRYHSTFPLMAKAAVNGEATIPVYAWLKEQAPGLLGSKAIKWNFTKFLIGRDGQVVRRYAPNHKPEDIAQDIEMALQAPAPGPAV